jgi:hypothetical protein
MSLIDDNGYIQTMEYFNAINEFKGYYNAYNFKFVGKYYH